jgi:hypothetical protein
MRSAAHDPPLSDIHVRFQELAKRWRDETGCLSSISKKTQHPAYREIVEMGEIALPFILTELRESPGHWFAALNEITMHSPVPPSDRTDPRKARLAWLAWGTEKGLID